MKNNDNFNNEVFAKEFAKLYKISLDMSDFELKFAYKRVEMWESIRNNHYQDKPLKIFKKKYLEWEKKLKEINEVLNNIYNDICTQIEDYNNLIKNN